MRQDAQHHLLDLVLIDAEGLAGEDAERMQKLLDMIEDLDDVQDVYHNAEL